MARDTVMEQRGHFFGGPGAQPLVEARGAKPPEDFQDFNLISLISNE